ncbi:MAG: Amuc_1100 family pilus-like protein, partial [Lentisphaerae bacterium]|nr:Amuc_1100 family pilus-like protein [Lentisphaerota bacterium]
LLIIDRLCRVVIEARVSELINVTREEFEMTAESATTGRRRGAAPRAGAAMPVAQPNEDDDLFTTQRFVFTLRGSERSVFNLLERLAALPMFTVVASVEMQNRRQETRERDAGGRQRSPAEQAGGPELPPEGERQDERGRQVIIGREDLEVKITVDVYQFAPSLPLNDSGQDV